MTKIICCGKGGDGIKYMSVILAKSAIKSKYDAKLLMNYGPEAREGDIKTYVTINKKRISNPVIENANYLISFNNSCPETFTNRYSTLINVKNNMFALGILSKILNLDLSIVIDTMKEETGKKHEEMIPLNINNITEGYNDHKHKKS